MTFSLAVASSSKGVLARAAVPSLAAQSQTRSVSSSPYGRTHVWKHRQRKLPAPFVPTFPQRVVRADGSTYVQHTTSPRSVFRLTRDTTNNPLWNASRWTSESEEEDIVTGRLGRFNRRFDAMGGIGGERVDWMTESEATAENEVLGTVVQSFVEANTAKKGKKGKK